METGNPTSRDQDPTPAPATSEADAGEGGTAAPPPARERNRAPGRMTREYRRGEIAVQWYASRCIHSAACVRALPGVFDPGRRPWIDLSGADPDAIADAVLRCPTGALHYTRHDGGPPEPVESEVTVQVVRDGPLYLRGPVEILDAEGGVFRQDGRVALCRCGRSGHMPFCDNSHRASEFRDPGLAPDPGG